MEKITPLIPLLIEISPIISRPVIYPPLFRDPYIIP